MNQQGPAFSSCLNDSKLQETESVLVDVGPFRVTTIGLFVFRCFSNSTDNLLQVSITDLLLVSITDDPLLVSITDDPLPVSITDDPLLVQTSTGSF